MSDDCTTELLETALSLLKRDGWCQNVLKDAEGRVCAVGALSYALQSVPLTALSQFPYSSALQRLIRGAGVADQTKIVEWNNAPDRTKEDVILAFKKAIHDE